MMLDNPSRISTWKEQPRIKTKCDKTNAYVHDVHKSKSRDGIGEEYGMIGRNIARYMRVDKLIPEFKEKLDDGTMTLVAAVDLSYLSEQEQGTVAKLYEKGEVKLDVKSAKAIRESAGGQTEKKIVGLYDGREKKMPAAMSIKIPSEVYQRFFLDKSPKEVSTSSPQMSMMRRS